MRRLAQSIGLSALVVLSAFSQNTATNSYWREAKVTTTSGKIKIEANSPRPLAQALDALQQKFGWIIDYEDPQYIAAKDISNASGPAGPTKYPAGGAFEVEVPASSVDPEKTLNQVVDAYNRSNNPGRFEVRKGSSGGFYVIGSAAHDEKGGISRQPILLDSAITLASEDRSVDDALTQLCQQLTAQNHVDVSIGISPRSLLDHNRTKVGGDKVAARDLLQQSLQATHHNLYWRLLFDPASKGYVLDIHSPHS